jgi:hypothetical protein
MLHASLRYFLNPVVRKVIKIYELFSALAARTFLSGYSHEISTPKSYIVLNFYSVGHVALLICNFYVSGNHRFTLTSSSGLFSAPNSAM